MQNSHFIIKTSFIYDKVENLLDNKIEKESSTSKNYLSIDSVENENSETNVAMYTCQVCSLTFINENELILHINESVPDISEEAILADNYMNYDIFIISNNHDVILYCYSMKSVDYHLLCHSRVFYIMIAYVIFCSF